VLCTVSCNLFFTVINSLTLFTPALHFSSLITPINLFHKDSSPPFPILHFTSSHSTSLCFIHFTSLYCTSLPSTLDDFTLHFRLFTSLDSTFLHFSMISSIFYFLLIQLNYHFLFPLFKSDWFAGENS